MNRVVPAFLSIGWLVVFDASAQAFRSSVAPLIQGSCVHCHDADTKTELNVSSLGDDLTDPATFRQWEDIYDRVNKGEMPPVSESRPDPEQLELALGSLKKGLRSANLAARHKYGRVPTRRLTRLEYDYTIRDLLSIEGEFATVLPEEGDSGSFDTVGTSQRLSALHVQSYLKAADQALDSAIRLKANPYRSYVFDFLNSSHLNEFHEKELRLGGNISRKLEDGVALFRDVDYLLRSDLHGFKVRFPGVYRISAEAEAFQSQEPVALKVMVKFPSGRADVVGAFDLIPGETHTFEVKTFLRRNNVFYPTLADEMPFNQILVDIYSAGGAKNYPGKGIAIKSLQVEGPLTDGWPPPSTRDLLASAKLTSESEDGAYEVELSKSSIEHVTEVVSHLAPRAFRRPLVAGELNALIDLAKPAIEEGRAFTDVVRIPLRSILCSPQFLLFAGEPGKLDDYALANRLAYFLWKSMPDDELFALAKAGKLSQASVLSRQVDRMLDDDKSDRFVCDFLGQWLRLYEINATTPDEKLYPEYDELLRREILKETELFFAELVKKNLGVSNIINSDFTFVNRRLAKHYGLTAVVGQELQRVDLPKESPRGGLLTQASILKVTANGDVTSPVTRGNFVLSNLLGIPPSPPPADVGFLEPDTRGTTTIRETLAEHRDIETCAKCHDEIDPPGFALESFDPIGGFRTKYRANANEPSSFLVTYKDGPEVDASGITADGKKFSGIREFKKHLLERKEQLATHFISQLVVYSTGGEIQFADREKIDALVERTGKADFPVRTIIHEVVQSKMFRNK